MWPFLRPANESPRSGSKYSLVFGSGTVWNTARFTEILRANSEPLARYLNRSEVLYFDARLLTDEIKRYFNVITAPSGLIRGWYVEREMYELALKGNYNLRSRMQARPEIGIIKTEESADFTYAKGLLHVEVSQRGRPFTSLS